MPRKKIYEYEATILRVIDGDTIEANVDVGFRWWGHKMRFRLLGINAPEMKGPTKLAGEASRDYLTKILMDHTADADLHIIAGGIPVLLRTAEDPDHFGRWLCTLLVEQDDGTLLDVCAEMISTGHAVEYVP